MAEMYIAIEAVGGDWQRNTNDANTFEQRTRAVGFSKIAAQIEFACLVRNTTVDHAVPLSSLSALFNENASTKTDL